MADGDGEEGGGSGSNRMEDGGGSDCEAQQRWWAERKGGRKEMGGEGMIGLMDASRSKEKEGSGRRVAAAHGKVRMAADGVRKDGGAMVTVGGMEVLRSTFLGPVDRALHIMSF